MMMKYSYLSQYPTPDIALLKHPWLLERLPDGVGGIGDSGYQGIDKLHPRSFSPRKKPRGKERPPEDILPNTAFSRRRIIVENANNRSRRYRLPQTGIAPILALHGGAVKTFFRSRVGESGQGVVDSFALNDMMTDRFRHSGPQGWKGVGRSGPH